MALVKLWHAVLGVFPPTNNSSSSPALPAVSITEPAYDSLFSEDRLMDSTPDQSHSSPQLGRRTLDRRPISTRSVSRETLGNEASREYASGSLSDSGQLYRNINDGYAEDDESGLEDMSGSNISVGNTHSYTQKILSKTKSATMPAFSRVKPLVRSITEAIQSNSRPGSASKSSPRVPTKGPVAKRKVSFSMTHSILPPKFTSTSGPPAPPIYCNCSDHGKIIALDRVFPIGMKDLADLLFGVSGDNAFLQNFMSTTKGFTKLEISPWSDAASSPTPNSVKTGMSRNLQCAVPLKYAIGPKHTRSVSEQRIAKFTATELLCVREVVQTPDVPSGQSFKVNSTICIMRDAVNPSKGFQQSRLHVGFDVEFVKSSWLKVPIERASTEGTIRFWRDIEKELMHKSKSMVPSTPMLERLSTQEDFAEDVAVDASNGILTRMTQLMQAHTEYSQIGALIFCLALIVMQVHSYQSLRNLESSLNGFESRRAYENGVTGSLYKVPEWWTEGCDQIDLSQDPVVISEPDVEKWQIETINALDEVQLRKTGSNQKVNSFESDLRKRRDKKQDPTQDDL